MKEYTPMNDMIKLIFKIGGGFFVALGVLATIFSIVFPITTGESWGFALIVVGALFFFLAYIIYFRPIIKDKRMKDEYEEQIRRERMEFERQNPNFREERFYQFCYDKYGVRGNTYADVVRMKSAAMELGYSWRENDLYNRFEIGRKSLIDKKERAEREKLESEIKVYISKQQNDHSNVYKRIHLTGISKTIDYYARLLSIERQELVNIEKQIKQTSSFKSNMYREANRTTSNWSIVGGAVSGIAGPVAGAYAAAEMREAEERDRQARVENANNWIGIANFTGERQHERKTAIENRIRNYEEKINGARRLLVEENLQQRELLEKFEPTDLELKQVVDGLVSIKIKTREANVVIYESVDAYIDGFFKALVYKNGALVLERYYELNDGYGTDRAVEMLPCYVRGTLSDTYTVAFESIKLWAVEKK